MPPQNLLPRRPEAERHKGTVKRRVGLCDRNERDARLLEPRGFARERGFVGHGEYDGVRVVGEVSWTTFPCCVDDHRGLEAAAQVLANQDVMSQGIFGRRRLAEITVVETSWVPA